MRVYFLAFSVGKLIVTKKVGQEVLPGLEDMEDITEIYKNPYGTTKTSFSIIFAPQLLDMFVWSKYAYKQLFFTIFLQFLMCISGY